MLDSRFSHKACNILCPGTLRLDQNRLVGTISSSLLTVSKDLNVLHLGNNLLAGQIPDAFDPSQPMEHLIQFTVQHNRFSGTLPKHVGFMTRLRVLEVDNNRLTGIIPREWSYLTNLEILRLVRMLLAFMKFLVC